MTMQQIADHLGVSKFVVSKSLAGKPGVSSSTRERVLQTAAKLGYFMNKNPYSSGFKETEAAGDDKQPAAKRMVLVLMPNIRFQNRENLYWGRILEGISSELDEQKLGMVIVTEQSDRLLELFNPQSLLGVIGVGMIPSPVLLDIHRAGIPLVLIDHDDPLIPADSLFVNNYDGLARLTTHLIGLGHRAIRFVGDIRYSRSFFDRWVGYRITMEGHGGDDSDPLADVELINLQGEQKQLSRTEAAGLLKQMKAEGKLPTAMLCANDVLALFLLGALAEAGIRVPEEVSVTGFDNIEDAYKSTPGLTTINVPKEFLGRRAVEMLLWRLQHPHDPIGKQLVSGDMIVRGSVGSFEAKAHN